MTTSQVQDERRARYEALVRSVVEPMRRYALRRADEASAQDAVSDALLVLWRRLDDIPPDAELPWAYAVTRRCLANIERSSRRNRGLTLRIARLDPPAAVTSEPAEGPDEELHEALRRLPPDDQELLRLWAWEDLRPAEIAVVLGVSANAVSIRLHRAKSRLSAELSSATNLAVAAPGETAKPARPRKSRAVAGQIRVDGTEGQVEGRSR